MSSVYFPVSQGYANLVTDPVVIPEPPTPKTMLMKIPYSAGAFIFGGVAGNRITYGKVECPTTFTHVRVHAYNAENAGGYRCSVAPTFYSDNTTIDRSFKPHNAQGQIDLGLWQHDATMPDITEVEDPNGVGTNFVKSSVSQWFPVTPILSPDGKRVIMFRLQVQTGSHNVVGGVIGVSSGMSGWDAASNKTYHTDFIARSSQTLTNITDYNEHPDQTLTGGYVHNFGIEFGTQDLNTRSFHVIGDSITADATIVEPEGTQFYWNNWANVAILNQKLRNPNLSYSVSNGAMSARSEIKYYPHYLDVVNTGAKFDYVICPAFTPNGGGLDGARVTEQQAFLDVIVAKTLELGSELILWEGIPNQGFGEATDARRKQVNAYGEQLAANNAHVHFMKIGSQINTRENPDRHIPEFSADAFHLRKIANNSIAEFVEAELDRIINGTVTPEPAVTITQTPENASAGEPITLTAVDTDASTLYWTSSDLILDSQIGNEITSTAIEGDYSVLLNARGAGGEINQTFSTAIAPPAPTVLINTIQDQDVAASSIVFIKPDIRNVTGRLRVTYRQISGTPINLKYAGYNAFFKAPDNASTHTIVIGVTAQDDLNTTAEVTNTINVATGQGNEPGAIDTQSIINSIINLGV